MFATYRDTRKFTNLTHNKRVSVMDGRHPQAPNGVHSNFVLGAVGRVQEISQSSYPVWLLAHVHKHPDLT